MASSSDVRPSVEELLAQCARLIVAHGPDSDQVAQFIERYQHEPEFVELANLSRALKKALERKSDLENLT